jgi:cytochrome P450
MLIPKDSIIIIPTWALHRDENVYPDPKTYNPDRFLQHPGLAADYAGKGDPMKRDE